MLMLTYGGLISRARGCEEVDITESLTECHVQRWLGPFTKLTDVVARRAYDSDLWEPTWRSEAEVDIAKTSVLPRASATIPTWGHEPCATVQTALAVLVRSVVEHTSAVALLLWAGGASTISIDALTRAALEAAAQAWWLAELGIGGRARVARLYVLRRESASAYEKTAKRMDLVPTAGYGHTVADIDALYHSDLGLVRSVGPKDGFKGCEQQGVMSYAERVAMFLRGLGHVPDGGPYPFYCGASHAEMWRLVQAYTVGPGSVSTLVPVASVDHVRAALAVCVDTLVYPFAGALAWLGRGASVTEFARLQGEIRDALRATWSPT